jgi:hypothetical protein
MTEHSPFQTESTETITTPSRHNGSPNEDDDEDDDEDNNLIGQPPSRTNLILNGGVDIIVTHGPPEGAQPQREESTRRAPSPLPHVVETSSRGRLLKGVNQKCMSLDIFMRVGMLCGRLGTSSVTQWATIWRRGVHPDKAKWQAQLSITHKGQSECVLHVRLPSTKRAVR